MRLLQQALTANKPNAPTDLKLKRYKMAQNADARLTKLEMTVEHQSNTIEEMSAVITDQWQTIERMQRKLDGLASRFVSLEEQAGTATENTRPPHW